MYRCSEDTFNAYSLQTGLAGTRPSHQLNPYVVVLRNNLAGAGKQISSRMAAGTLPDPLEVRVVPPPFLWSAACKSYCRNSSYLLFWRASKTHPAAALPNPTKAFWAGRWSLICFHVEKKIIINIWSLICLAGPVPRREAGGGRCLLPSQGPAAPRQGGSSAGWKGAPGGKRASLLNRVQLKPSAISHRTARNCWGSCINLTVLRGTMGWHRTDWSQIMVTERHWMR